MDIEEIINNNYTIAILKSNSIIIGTTDDGIDLVGNLYYQGYNKAIIRQEHIAADFFDLKNGMAGEILQKFSTYQVRLAIIGDFSIYTNQSIQQFIAESNRYGHINFVDSTQKAIEALIQ